MRYFRCPENETHAASMLRIGAAKGEGEAQDRQRRPLAQQHGYAERIRVYAASVLSAKRTLCSAPPRTSASITSPASSITQ